MNRRELLEASAIAISVLGVPGCIATNVEEPPFFHLKCGDMKVSFDRKDLLPMPASSVEERFYDIHYAANPTEEDGYCVITKQWKNTSTITICLSGAKFADSVSNVLSKYLFFSQHLSTAQFTELPTIFYNSKPYKLKRSTSSFQNNRKYLSVVLEGKS
jgi:hypothetical protein